MKVTGFDRRSHPNGVRFSLWEAADGWKMRRMDWPVPSGSRRRGSLLFIGGRGDFIEKYLEAYAHWNERGWGVTAFDWRGQGGSAGAIVGGHLDSFEPLVADGAAFLEDWLGAEPGPHVAIGHSMGGHLLLRIIAERRPSLAAAVLVAPMLGVNAAPLPPRLAPATARIMARLLGATARPWREEGDERMTKVRQTRLTSCSDRFADEMWWHERQPAYRLGPVSWGWLAAAYASIAALRPAALRRIELPLLLLGTEADRLVSAPAIRRAAGLIPGAELHMYSDAAHELLRESDEVRLDALARIDGFLDRAAA